jgi:hypothetical protein
VSTWNNIQILDQHIPVTAADDQRGRVIGSTGTHAIWNAPYIDNSLVFWSDPAIAMIESGEMRELSSAYRYDPVMTPGNYQGQQYDGVMTNIRANHVALVEAGRAGSDVVVMDSKPKETAMKMLLSPRAAFLAGSTAAYLGPYMAKDQKVPDVSKLFAGVTAKNWKEKRPTVEAAILRATKGKMANDAEVHIHEHLDGAGAGAPDDVGALAAPGEAGTGDPQAPTDAGVAETPVTRDDDLAAKVQQLLQGQIDDNDLAIILHALKSVEQPDPAAPPANGNKEADPAAAPPKKDDDNGVVGDEDDDDCAEDEDDVAAKLPGLAMKDTAAMDAKPVTKVAMDAAIAKAVKEATEKTRKQMDAREQATRFVRPWVGDLAVAMDSAREVYKFALEQMGEDVTDIHPSAYKALLAKIPKPNEQQAPRQIVAMDNDSNKQFMERFPNANRLVKH